MLSEISKSIKQPSLITGRPERALRWQSLNIIKIVWSGSSIKTRSGNAQELTDSEHVDGGVIYAEGRLLTHDFYDVCPPKVKALRECR